MLSRADAIAYCRQEADRLRLTLRRTTTERLKARLAERIDELERIAKGEAAEPPGFELTIAKSRW